MMSRQAFNPFLSQDTYIPDGEPHIFKGRIYIFGSHDKENGDSFCMLPYVFYSAPVDDLSNWSCKGISYEAMQDPFYSTKRPFMFAPDVVMGNDGRYYLYYCLAGLRGKYGYSGPFSVAVCDTPDGEYKYLGFVKNPDGSPFLRFIPFDPALINDDGVIRLYYGTQYPFDNYSNILIRQIFHKIQSKIFGKSMSEIKTEAGGVMGPVHVTLDEDMLTVNSQPRKIAPANTRSTQWKEHPFFEAASIRKIDDIYYFIYSSMLSHELCYATSYFPDRDFTFGGTLISNGDIGYRRRKPKDRLNATGTTHGSIECINGQWYVFYHRLTHGSDYSRQACAEKITILPDGSISQVEMTSCGLNSGPLVCSGTYLAVICCNLSNGRMPHIQNRKLKMPIPRISSNGHERFISDMNNDTMIGYKYFLFTGKTTLRVTYRGDGGELSVGVENNKILEKIALPPSLNWIQSEVMVFQAEGELPLFFLFRGSGKIDILEIQFKE